MVKSSEELQPIIQLGNKIYLRKNIEQVEITEDGETRQEWQADEALLYVEELAEGKDIVDVENNFDVYFNFAKEKREKEQLERRLKIKTKKAVESGNLELRQQEQDDYIDDTMQMLLEQEGLI